MTDDIVARIDRRIHEAQGQIEQLQHARRQLVDGDAGDPRRPAARRGGRRSSPQRPPVQVVPAGTLLALLGDGDGDGLSSAELAAAANGSTAQVRVLLRELEAADQVRRSGGGRGTRWHMITDEDRIAARAAELRAQSRSAGR